MTEHRRKQLSGSDAAPAAQSDWFEPLFNIDGPSIGHITIAARGAPVLDVRKVDGAANYTLQAVDPAYGADKNVVADTR
jgi:hypothetical protein